MTGGIGNPDWQRRYVTSAVPILTGTFLDDTNRVSGISDSNGYQYLLVSTNDPGATTYKHVKVDWFQDQGATLQMGTTDYTIQPNTFNVLKVPVITRWYKVEIGPVGGATGHNTTLVVYGTNADQENILTQNTAIPMAIASSSVAAGATMTTTVSGTFGGEVMLNMDDNVNNKWTAWMDYYDWSAAGWVTYWSTHGTDKGQAYTERIFLPYAPTRMNFRNDDTVSHILAQRMIAA